PAREEDGLALARFEVEAGALIRLCEAGRHEGVVPIHDFKASQTHACLVMDFIPGLNLRQWCSTHQVSLRERAALIARVARAAGWFHGLGVIHRDLKPANILVHAVTRQPVIVDFSIARMEDSLTLTLTNETLGTAPYMAPEQFDRRRAPATPATDVYALGASLYELLTQVPPHPGEFAVIVQRHHDEVRPAPPSVLNPAVPRDLESIILKALSHRPADRYADGTALAEDLERFLAGEPVKARPLPLVTRLVRRARKKPALTAALASSLALLIAAVFITAHASRQSRQHELESRITQIMRETGWTEGRLMEAEAALSALHSHDPARAAHLADAFLDDVEKDISHALQQPRLTSADEKWMQAAIATLRGRAPELSARLERQMQERQSRWETLVDLKPPFENRAGLFPRGRQSIRGDLLFPDYEDSAGISPSVAVKEGFPTPVEISTTLVSTGPFRHAAFTLVLQKARVDVGLYAAAHAPKDALAAAGGMTPDAGGGVFFILKHGAVESAAHIPEAGLFEQPFHITLRADERGLQAELNQRWTLTSDPVFTFALPSEDNQFRISWARTLGMSSLSIRSRQPGQPSPLEQGDRHAVAGEWSGAQASYEQLVGHPLSGPEALYKLGISQDKQGDSAAAHLSWRRLADGPPGLWRDLALYQLWRAAVLQQGTTAARPLLDRLPAPGSIPPELTRAIPSADRGKLAKAYARASLGLNFLRVNTAEMDEAMKACAILGIPALETAYQLAGGYHMAGADSMARELANRGLTFPSRQTATPDILGRALGLLDQWGRMDHPESVPELRDRLAEWTRALPQDASFTALTLINQARIHARAGRLEAALPLLESIHALKEVEPRLVTHAMLVEGAVLNALGRQEEARAAWLSGIRSASESATQNPLQLYDRIMMHHATRTWDAGVCDEVINRILGKGKDGLARLTLQGMFLRAFASDPAYVGSLNAFCADPEGRAFIEDYALVRRPARELFRHWFSRMLEHFILASSLPPGCSPEDRARVRQTISQTLAWISSTEDWMEVMGGFFLAWSSRAPGQMLQAPGGQPPPDLLEKMRWLLDQRSQTPLTPAGGQ
ncbi:MAG TPA: protein kinase, partial [Prosthecobacter sp.]|nr:protein kinase [Prosthecobacter sp.]